MLLLRVRQIEKGETISSQRDGLKKTSIMQVEVWLAVSERVREKLLELGRHVEEAHRDPRVQPGSAGGRDGDTLGSLLHLMTSVFSSVTWGGAIAARGCEVGNETR